MEKKSWFNSTLWAEGFIAIIIARLVQYLFLPDFGLIILLPISVVVVHLLLNKWIQKMATVDLFKKA